MKPKQKTNRLRSPINLVVRRRNSRLRQQQAKPPSQLRSEEDVQVLMQITEGVIFIAREPITTTKLVQYARLHNGKEARQLIEQLNIQYDKTNCAYRIEQVAGGYQLMSRPAFSSWLKRLEHTIAPQRFSTPSIETLAVIAYRQPIMRAEIEAIRGVGCGEVIRQLMERDLVRVAGRSEELGRPYLYATTRIFLGLFGLGSIDDLPAMKIPMQLELPEAA
ncbi:MAG: SMC-Scp complex subunit ScpB [Planctomycetaceae bacterium]|jgi:segregation and condensation protein B|nr:SMC-Scp complex subunit ScpB [Planctomycetaceae bacterium]